MAAPLANGASVLSLLQRTVFLLRGSGRGRWAKLAHDASGKASLAVSNPLLLSSEGRFGYSVIAAESLSAKRQSRGFDPTARRNLRKGRAQTYMPWLCTFCACRTHHMMGCRMRSPDDFHPSLPPPVPIHPGSGLPDVLGPRRCLSASIASPIAAEVFSQGKKRFPSQSAWLIATSFIDTWNNAFSHASKGRISHIVSLARCVFGNL